MRYAVYTTSGEILKVGIAPAGTLEEMRRGGELVLELEPNSPCLDTTHYIQDGQLLEMPERPSIQYIFNYTTKTWVDPRTPETEWPLVRAKRNSLLQQSDWTQLPDVPLDTKDAWAAYRQALRDVTDQPDPFNITWPVPPGP